MRRPYRIALVTLVLAASSFADDLKDALSLLKKNDERSLLWGAQKARGLGPKAKRAVPLLIKHLGNEDWGVREAMKKSLIAIGPAAVPAMLSIGRNAATEVSTANTTGLETSRAPAIDASRPSPVRRWCV